MKKPVFLTLCLIAVLLAPVTYKGLVILEKRFNCPVVHMIGSTGEVIEIFDHEGNPLPWTDDLDQFEHGYTTIFVSPELSVEQYVNGLK